MHTHHHARWQHEHVFDTGNAAGERGTRWVLWITLVAMAVEIAAGWWFNSMALLADGFHISSHALAIGLSAFAYAAALKHARDPRFAFGTWKIEILETLLERLVALDAKRAAEEAAGTVRWLRPEFQARASAGQGTQAGLDAAPEREPGDGGPAAAPGRPACRSRSRPWPSCWPPARSRWRWPIWNSASRPAAAGASGCR
jgi:hypothetical protein